MTPLHRIQPRNGALALITIATLTLGCASYRGTASAVQPSTVARGGNWMMVQHFPLVLQEHDDDCGAAALSAILGFWGRPASVASIQASLGSSGRRLRAGDMVAMARRSGLSAYVFFGNVNDLLYELRRGRPIIVGLGKAYSKDKAISHYEVVVGYEPTQKRVLLLDPGRGWQVDGLEGFAREWSLSKAVTIVAFLPGTAGAGGDAPGAASGT